MKRLISIIIPAWNEERRIGETLEKLAAFEKTLGKNELFEIIVVFDGTDSTPEMVGKFAKKNPETKLIKFNKRLGKGGAIVEGMKAARGDCLVYDADSSVPATEIPKLLEALESFPVAIGSRRHKLSKITKRQPPFRRIASKLFNMAVKTLFGLEYKDTQCGFKAIKREAARELLPEFQERGFSWDVELLLLARKHGLKVAEVPVEWAHAGRSNLKPSDSIGMLSALLRMKKIGL
jgi:glycosyltransferase involved in cell wall biosynthesis